MTNLQFPILPKHIWENITFADASVNGLTAGAGRRHRALPAGVVRPGAGRRPERQQGLLGWRTPCRPAPLPGLRQRRGPGQCAHQRRRRLPGRLPVDAHRDPPRRARRDRQHGQGQRLRRARLQQLGPDPGAVRSRGLRRLPQGPHDRVHGRSLADQAGRARGDLPGLLDKQALIDQAVGGYARARAPRSCRRSHRCTPTSRRPATRSPSRSTPTRPARRPRPRPPEQRFGAVMAGLGFADTDGNGILNVPQRRGVGRVRPGGCRQGLVAAPVRPRGRRRTRRWPASSSRPGSRPPASTSSSARSARTCCTRPTYPYSSNADYDMYIWGWGPDPDPHFILSIFTCNQINGW